MSGDVQPRKRRDKRRKRDALDRKSEGEMSFVRQDSLQEDDEASHGVHITKMGSDDVHLHVQEDHGTGGHWCAKLFFFVLLAVLLGLIGLIIMENRGLSDLDTPLSESRFSNYFDGWVDESRHDEHDAVQASIEEHEEHDEPFEELEDHSELDENGGHGGDDDEDDHDGNDDDDDHDDADEDNDEEEKDEDEPQTAETENATEENDENDDNVQNDNDNDENDEDDVTKEKYAEDTQVSEEQDAEDEEDGDNDNDDNATNENEDQDVISEENDEGNNDDDGDDGDDADDQEQEQDDDNNDQSENGRTAEDDDDDDNFGSVEELVADKVAEDRFLLREKHAKQRVVVEEEDEEDDEEKGEASKEIVEEDDETEPNNANDASSSWAGAQINARKSNDGGPKAHHDDIDSFERDLHEANEEMMRERYGNAVSAFQRLSEKYSHKPEAALSQAHALDKLAEKLRSNKILENALKAYQNYLAFNDSIKNEEFRQAAARCIERMRFMGLHMKAIPIHKQLMQRFKNEPGPRNELAVTYLLMNRMSEAKIILKETLDLWPDDGFALVHYGFILKQQDLDYENAVSYLSRGIATKAPGTRDGRFYFNLGDALQRLGRQKEALKVYGDAASLGLFPSVYQRSLYNEKNLRAQPFWNISETTYAADLQRIKNNWQAIRDEGLNLLSKEGYFQKENENLRQQGDWKQFELYARGQQTKKNCLKAPITCGLIAKFAAASGCRRGQIKFSVIHPGTHVWPHCGPTNCRLRAHLGLIVPKGARLRVAEEQRTWMDGEFLIFDDSFEHEVWHEGNSTRLVLIVDVWHPDLSLDQRQKLTSI